MWTRSVFPFLALLSVLLAAPGDLLAQSLRGGPASVKRMHRSAVAHDLHFYETDWGVRNAVEKGRFVPLPGNADYRTHDVNFPYVKPTTRTFVERLAAQYRQGCGEQLVVTSAVRPESRQPWNSHSLSVHPTGMAIDLRKPRGRCRAWLRETLLWLEGAGLIEATEEHRPPHFHVAVHPGPYRRYVARRTGDPTEYQVRKGDSLWSIARRHDTTVTRIRSLNDLRSSRIYPGQDLLIPTES